MVLLVCVCSSCCFRILFKRQTESLSIHCFHVCLLLLLSEKEGGKIRMREREALFPQLSFQRKTKGEAPKGQEGGEPDSSFFSLRILQISGGWEVQWE